MDREAGNKSFPIWLLGDSNPVQWQDKLYGPFDARHPIRHNIWTSVLEVIQDRVYRERRLRVNSNEIYIRNAVDESKIKPSGTAEAWSSSLNAEILRLAQLLEENQPKFLFSFGAFAYEFGRRALAKKPPKKYVHWGATKLGDEFRLNVGNFNPEEINLIPLLHRIVAGGKFLESQDYFCGLQGANYFDYVGEKIAALFLKFQDVLPIWIE